MAKVILDTNFLIYCAKNKLDYKEELMHLLNEDVDLVVPNQVIDELGAVMQKIKPNHIELIKKRNPLYKRTSGKDKESAKLALQLLDFYKVRKVDIKGKNVDDAIINLANEDSKNIVATLDREMRKILGRVILINRFKRLILTK
jgi:rRNA-processing protein FCF1